MRKRRRFARLFLDQKDSSKWDAVRPARLRKSERTGSSVWDRTEASLGPLLSDVINYLNLSRVDTGMIYTYMTANGKHGRLLAFACIMGYQYDILLVAKVYMSDSILAR